MVLSKFRNLGVVVGLAGTLSQIVFFPSVSHAESVQRPRSITEQNICKADGQYAVFALHPLTEGAWRTLPPRKNWADNHNNEWAHEHIFFCNNRVITDNIGFSNKNDGSRFSYSTNDIVSGRTARNGIIDNPNLTDFVLINENRYDTDIIKEILGVYQNSCSVPSDGRFNLVKNNCQDFTAKVRKDYKKRMLSGVWTRSRTAFEGNDRGCFAGSTSGKVPDITLSQKDYRLTVPGKFVRLDDGSHTSGAGGEVRGNQFTLTDAGGGFIITYEGTVTDKGNTLTGKATCRYGSGSATATNSFTWKRKAIGPSLAEGL